MLDLRSLVIQKLCEYNTIIGIKGESEEGIGLEETFGGALPESTNNLLYVEVLVLV